MNFDLRISTLGVGSISVGGILLIKYDPDNKAFDLSKLSTIQFPSWKTTYYENFYLFELIRENSALSGASPISLGIVLNALVGTDY